MTKGYFITRFKLYNYNFIKYGEDPNWFDRNSSEHWMQFLYMNYTGESEPPYITGIE